MTSKLFSQLDIVAAAANMTLIAVDLSSADKRVMLGGNGGIPYNDSSGRLVGTAVVGGVTPTSNIPFLNAVNTWAASQNFAGAITVQGFGFFQGTAANGGYFYFGRTAIDGRLGAIGSSDTTIMTGAAAGDCYLKALTGVLWLGNGNSPAMRFSAPDSFAQGNFKIEIVGKGLYIKEGTNATMGTLTLNGTTGVVVSTTKVTANSRIFLTHNATGGTPGFCYVDSRVAGTSFTVKGTAGDTSTVAWMIVEPA